MGTVKLGLLGVRRPIVSLLLLLLALNLLLSFQNSFLLLQERHVNENAVKIASLRCEIENNEGRRKSCHETLPCQLFSHFEGNFGSSNGLLRKMHRVVFHDGSYVTFLAVSTA